MSEIFKAFPSCSSSGADTDSDCACCRITKSDVVATSFSTFFGTESSGAGEVVEMEATSLSLRSLEALTSEVLSVFVLWTPEALVILLENESVF